MTTNRRLLAALAALSMLLLSVPLQSALAAGSSNPPVTPSANPDLAASCGTDVSLVLDRSGSIGSNNTKVRDAAQTFVDALVGTGSKVQVVSFSDRATAEPGSGSALSDLAFVDPASLTIPTFPSAGTTNWDDALEMVRRSPAGHAPLVVMITDGNPTRRNQEQPDGHGGTLAGNGSSSTQEDLDAAVTEANLLKALPSHMFVVGVGAALSNASSEARVVSLSGPDKLTFAGGVANVDFGQADYTLVSDFAALETTVARFVRELCGPSLNIVKHLQLADGSTVPAGDADPFTFDVSLDPAPSLWTAPAQVPSATASLTTVDGSTNFVWDPATPTADTTITLAERARTGWVYNGQRCWVNNLDGTPPQMVVNDVGANVIGASKPATGHVLPAVGAYQAMNCEVFNRQLRTSTVSVDKVTSPSARPETFTFTLERDGDTLHTLDGIGDATAPTAFPAVLPGTYDVVEATHPHFDVTGASCDDLGTQGIETASPSGLRVDEGTNWKCTFTNALHDGSIRIVKDLVGAGSGTFGFTSNIPGHASFDLSPTSATDASVTMAAAPGTYSVAEGASAPFSLQVQCDQGSTPGAIVVTPDVTTTCTFTNTAPDPTIVVTKSAQSTVVDEPGADVAFDVSVENTSIETLTLSVLTDEVGGNTVDLFGLAPNRSTCGPLAGASMAPGQVLGCTFTMFVSGNAGDTVTDTVRVVAVDADQNEAQDTATADVDVADVLPSLVVSKVAGSASVAEPGGPVVFDVEVSNPSGEAVTLVSLEDRVGGGAWVSLLSTGPVVTATSCALVSIPAGGSYACAFTMGVAGNAGDVVADTVRAVAVDDDGSEVSATDDAEVTVSDVLPLIEVTKSADPSSIAEPGGLVSYTVGVTNLTAEPVILGSFVDAIDGGTPFVVVGTCAALTGTSLAPHASTSCVFALPVIADASDGSVSDVVTVSAADDDGNSTQASDGASVTITDVLPEITVTKTAGVASVPEPGAVVSYTVEITNDSVEPVTIDAIVDRIGDGPYFDVTALPGTCDDLAGTSLGAGSSAGCVFDLAVEGDGGDVVADTVMVTAGDDDGNQVTATDGASVEVTDVLPEISVSKTADVASVPEPGAEVTYTVVVSNGSVEPVTLTSLSDVVGSDPAVDVTTLDTTCSLPQVIAVDGQYTCTFTIRTSGNAGDSVGDVVTATATDDDDNVASADGSAAVAVTDVGPTITVEKTATTETLQAPGGPASYTVEMANTSPEPVTIVSIVDTIGDDDIDVTTVAAPVTGTTCAAGAELAASGEEGDTYACTFTLTISGSEAAEVTDVVTVVAVDDEGNEVTADDDATTNLTPVADLAIDKEIDGTPVVGLPATYTLTVTNDGPSTAVAPIVTDQMPEFLTATSAAGEDWDCEISADGRTVTCTTDALAPGASTEIVIVATVGEPGDGVPIVNTATIGSPTPDPDLTNNTDTVSVEAVPTVLEPAASPDPVLPATGQNVRGWLIAADVLLILGLALRLGRPVLQVRRTL